MDKKKEKEGNNGKELVEMHLFPLKVKHSCQYFFCIQSHFKKKILWSLKM